MKPRDVLNKLKWGEGGLKFAKITIIHRGAEGDRRVINGSCISELERGVMVVRSADGEVRIPYHRILKIENHEKIIWERRRWSSS